MYGVPADLPVQRFIGDILCQVRIGMDGVHFAFNNSGIISVGGRWELIDSSGEMVDCACDYDKREAYRLHALFNQEVVNCSINPPHSFSLMFASGHRLTIYDDTPQYESFSIQPGNFFV
jgi:hypothetical protein